MDTTTRRARWTPNLFGIAFGFSGLADCWSAAHAAGTVPVWPANVLWIIAALLWLGIGARYLGRPSVRRSLRVEFADPVFSPFLALLTILPMLFGVALGEYAPTAGKAVFFTALVATVILGGWLTGGWILSDTRQEQWHSGYFLPTVAAGFVAAQGSAVFGHPDLARLMFGYGVVSWFVLGSILQNRLFTFAALPGPLVPTIAIQMAPPVVAGGAWFAMNGGRPDPVALGLAGYAVLMVLVQLRLLPLYRTVAFGPGWWAYSFSVAAVINDAILWLAAAARPSPACSDHRVARRRLAGHRHVVRAHPQRGASPYLPTATRSAGPAVDVAGNVAVDRAGDGGVVGLAVRRRHVCRVSPSSAIRQQRLRSASADRSRLPAVSAGAGRTRTTPPSPTRR